MLIDLQRPDILMSSMEHIMRIYDPSSHFFFLCVCVCLLGTEYVFPPRVRGLHTDSPRHDLRKWDIEDEVSILWTQKVEFLTYLCDYKKSKSQAYDACLQFHHCESLGWMVVSPREAQTTN